ncbi:VWA domain-containing protein [Catenuloplanes sp. NPDC051500]|uniref:VWA domain-containing protein n=1 Tax=Catenuloplanes sp. NPDC051500 TaxID=3363959 RepID=UPI00378AC141
MTMAGERGAVDASGAAGVQIGDHGQQHNRFHLEVPRSIRVALIAVLALAVLAAGGWAVVALVLPQFAPTYKTEFLIDASAAADADGLAEITESLRTVVGNSGDRDSLALRSFGGECGSDGNTTQLVDFGTGNRETISTAAKSVKGGGVATLQRGIVQAIEDFSRPFAQDAKQVNRIVVVARQGEDACDTDTAFVQREIGDRIAAAGLDIEFRVIGYRVAGDQQEQLALLATGSGAPEPMFVETADDLNAALEWFTNVEPVLRNAKAVIDVLNPTVDTVNEAVTAVGEGRLDVADRRLTAARDGITAADTAFEDLDGRTGTAAAADLNRRALLLKDLQRDVVESASTLLADARDGKPLGPGHDAFTGVANGYNAEVTAMNEALAALRATAPEGVR